MALPAQKRYSEAFKLKVMEELRDGKWKTVKDAARAYGVSDAGIHKWMKALGFDYLKGRIIYVKTRSEADRIKELEREIRRLKERLADEILDHQIAEATLEVCCERLGVKLQDVKKKNGGR